MVGDLKKERKKNLHFSSPPPHPPPTPHFSLFCLLVFLSLPFCNGNSRSMQSLSKHGSIKHHSWRAILKGIVCLQSGPGKKFGRIFHLPGVRCQAINAKVMCRSRSFEPRDPSALLIAICTRGSNNPHWKLQFVPFSKQSVILTFLLFGPTSPELSDVLS